MPKSLLPQKPFKGPTPEKVFQTISIGEGGGDYLGRQAKKFPRRKYLALDPAYKDFLPTPLRKANIAIAHNLEGIDTLVQNGYRARHANFDMPNPEKPLQYDYSQIFRYLSQLLLPNGKVFVRSENPELLEFIASHARPHGFKIGRQKPERQEAMKGIETKRGFKPGRTFWTTRESLEGNSIYKLELSLHPRKANK